VFSLRQGRNGKHFFQSESVTLRPVPLPQLRWVLCLTPSERKVSSPMTWFHAIEMPSITGQPLSFKQYKGQICLVVNVASE